MIGNEEIKKGQVGEKENQSICPKDVQEELPRHELGVQGLG